MIQLEATITRGIKSIIVLLVLLAPSYSHTAKIGNRESACSGARGNLHLKLDRLPNERNWALYPTKTSPINCLKILSPPTEHNFSFPATSYSSGMPGQAFRGMCLRHPATSA